MCRCLREHIRSGSTGISAQPLLQYNKNQHVLPCATWRDSCAEAEAAAKLANAVGGQSAGGARGTWRAQAMSRRFDSQCPHQSVQIFGGLPPSTPAIAPAITSESMLRNSTSPRESDYVANGLSVWGCCGAASRYNLDNLGPPALRGGSETTCRAK